MYYDYDNNYVIQYYCTSRNEIICKINLLDVYIDLTRVGVPFVLFL